MAPQIGRQRSLSADIKHQRAAPGAQVDLVSVVRLAPALADEVGMRLEQTHHLLAGRFRVEHAALGLLLAREGPGRCQPRYTNSRPTAQLRNTLRPVPPPRSRRARHQAQQPPVGGRPRFAARRADLLARGWPHGSGRAPTPAAAARAPPAAVASAPAPRRTTGGCPTVRGYPSRSRCCRCAPAPDSIPCCLASCNSTPLMACQASAIAPTALCTPTFSAHGTDRARNAARRRNRAAAPTPDCSAQMHEHRTAQNGLAGQPRAPPGRAARHAGPDHVEQFWVSIEPCRSAFQFAGDRMDNFRRRYAGLNGASVTHRDLRCFGCCWCLSANDDNRNTVFLSTHQAQFKPIQQVASLRTGTPSRAPP